MTNKILCPWCGHEMFVPRPWLKGTPDMEGHNWTVRAKCRNCNAVSPDGCGRTEQGALNDMMRIVLRRYTPPLKPMERQELPRHYLMPCWIERIGEKTYPDLLDKDSTGFYGKFENLNARETDYLFYANYGRTWRCWARRPTDEERSAAEWEM